MYSNHTVSQLSANLPLTDTLDGADRKSRYPAQGLKDRIVLPLFLPMGS